MSGGKKTPWYERWNDAPSRLALVFGRRLWNCSVVLLCFAFFWGLRSKENWEANREIVRKLLPLAGRSLKKGGGEETCEGKERGTQRRVQKNKQTKNCGPASARRLPYLSRGRRGAFCGTWPCSQTCCGPSGSWQTLGRRAGGLRGLEGALSVQLISCFFCFVLAMTV